MARTPARLEVVLARFLADVAECRQIAVDAEQWSSGSPGLPAISDARRDQLVELSFLRACLAWEVFIEQSFTLYANGNKPPKGRAPARYVYPPNLVSAKEWVIPEGKQFATWDDPAQLQAKAARFFKDGRPFSTAISIQRASFGEMKKIRNAIAHKSVSANEKFEELARQKLGTLPPRTTVGKFLGSRVRQVTPPVSYLEEYVGKLELAAKIVVPS